MQKEMGDVVFIYTNYTEYAVTPNWFVVEVRGTFPGFLSQDPTDFSVGSMCCT